jgi:hypothetical protein
MFFCKKPMAITVADCNEMIGVVERTRKVAISAVMPLDGNFWWKQFMTNRWGKYFNPIYMIIGAIGVYPMRVSARPIQNEAESRNCKSPYTIANPTYNRAFMIVTSCRQCS